MLNMLPHASRKLSRVQLPRTFYCRKLAPLTSHLTCNGAFTPRRVLARYYEGSHLIGRAIYKSLTQLLVPLFMLFVMIFFFSMIMYDLEWDGSIGELAISNATWQSPMPLLSSPLSYPFRPLPFAPTLPLCFPPCRDLRRPVARYWRHVRFHRHEPRRCGLGV